MPMLDTSSLSAMLASLGLSPDLNAPTGTTPPSLDLNQLMQQATAAAPVRATAPVQIPAGRQIPPTAAPTSPSGHGVDWHALMSLVAPMVGEVASRGSRGSFLEGFMRARERADQTAKQDAEAAQQRKIAGANYLLQIGQHAEGITDPTAFDNFLQQAEHAGTQAGYVQPGELQANIHFNNQAAREAQLKELTDQLTQLDKNGYDLDQLAASGAALHLKSGQMLPVKTALDLTRERPVSATGQPVAKPSKQDTAASTDFGRYLAKFAKDKGKTVDTLTTAEELAAKDQFAQAGRAPADPELAGMHKALLGLQISAAEQKQKDAASGGLTEDGLDYAATQLRLTGVMPPMGMGGGTTRTSIINRAAAQTKALGQSPAATIQKQAAYKADASALTQMRRMSSAAEAFETKALAQADIVEGLSAKVNRTQYPLLNDALLAGKERILGDTNTQLFYNALSTFTTEYAKIMEGSTGSAAGSSQDARAAASKLISVGLNKGTLAQTLGLMRKEMRLTIQGYDATVDHITSRMGGAPPAAPAATTPAAGVGLTYEDYLKAKGQR